jgi:hypothetical protein
MIKYFLRGAVEKAAKNNRALAIFHHEMSKEKKMRITRIRICLAMVLILISSVSAMAIEISGVGVKAGMNFARLSGIDVDQNWKYRMAIVGGAFFTLKFNDVLAIQPEILYSQKGPKWDAPLEGVAFVGTVKLDYLEIPVLVKIFIPVGANAAIRPNLFVGPYMAFKMSARLKYTWGSTSEDRTIDGIKSTDLGYVLGGGLDFVVGKGKITLDVRYGMSFSTISTDSTEKNQSISAMIGYSFK